MRLVTFSHQDVVRIGLLITQGQGSALLDLAAACPELPRTMQGLLAAGEPAMRAARAALAEAPAHARLALAEVALLAPLPRPGKIICIGHNYTDHSAMAPGELPEYPTFFSKYSTCVIGPGQPIVLPRVSQQVDNEAELAVVIGRAGRFIREQDALEHVAGYTIFNDVSARDYQRRTTQWMMGKTFDTFGPMGPALVTRDELADVANLTLSLRVNGREVQRGSTSGWIFALPFLIAYLSEVMTLEPGDLISTGTPSRVGEFRERPAFMRPGDQVQIEIEGIGVLENSAAAQG
ncbi:fumarylacetoacetate hydrolase family protein [Chloroflexia bacterium SDU3-3]|nr:fumarylacetoacetate hydrolase family protein [Chloroflexia bacterium SDU3-3]